MFKDKFGRIALSTNEIFSGLYSGRISDLSSVVFENEQELNRFMSAVKENYDRTESPTSYTNLEISIEEFDQLNQKNWFMPDEYKNMDIEAYLVHVCPKQNYQRLIEELQEFKSRNMLNLLRWLKYFVDTCRKNNVIWGVGRGSSVSSYVLYLLGIHKIDSIKYKLDYREFLR